MEQQKENIMVHLPHHTLPSPHSVSCSKRRKRMEGERKGRWEREIAWAEHENNSTSLFKVCFTFGLQIDYLMAFYPMHWVQWCSLKWHTTAHFYTCCFHSIFTSVLFLGHQSWRIFSLRYISWLSGVSTVCFPSNSLQLLFNNYWDTCTKRVCMCFLNSLPKAQHTTDGLHLVFVGSAVL